MMANSWNKLPSEVMNIKDEYTAYCLNEAVDEIIYHLKNKETPTFEVKYKRFSDFYKQFD